MKMSSLSWLTYSLYTGLVCILLLPQAVLYADCTSTETTALVLDYMAGDDRWSWCWGAEEVKISLAYWGIREDEGEVYLRQQMEITDTPGITIVTLEEQIPGKRVVYISTHGGSTDVAFFGAEFYDTRSAMEDNIDCYTDPARPHPYVRNTEMAYWLDYEPVMPPGGPTDTTYVIVLTETAVENHLNSEDPSKRLADEAIVYGSWCSSMAAHGKWGEATFVGPQEPMAWDVSCNALRTFWRRLRCAEYPRYEPNTQDAATNTPLGVEGAIRDNRLDCYRDCRNPITHYTDAGVFGNTLWWETSSEAGSEGFRVRGFRSLDSEPEELLTVPARGGPGLRQRYWVEVPGGYDRYDVVEWDTRGGATVSHRIPRTAKPGDWEAWISEPTLEIGATEPPGDPKPLVEIVEGEAVPIELRRSGGSPGSLDSPPSDALCADAVIYSSEQSFLWEVQAHLGREGLKYRSFVGTHDPEDTRTAYGVVLQANEDYQTACQSYPGGCDKEYPVSPGPLLIISGGVSIVWHAHVPTEHGECTNTYPPECMSDLDMTDVDGDGTPDGPVTRILADESGDVYHICHSAEDFNHGRYLDEGLHLVTTIGDCSQDDSSRCGGWPVDFVGDIRAAYLDMGYAPHPTLFASDYLPFSPADAKVEACRNQINAGVMEMWGVDVDDTYELRWPGRFICANNYPASLLETRQRFVAWLPGCQTVSTWYGSSGYAPLIEKLMRNDSQKTVLVGAVGHLHGGWSSQHEDFGRILLEERQNAQPGTPIARIAYDAVIRAQAEQPHLFDYARSVGVVGGYVTLPGFVCQAGHKECQVTSPREGASVSKGLVQPIDWRMCLGMAEGERIRKHSLFESRDDGLTWSMIADSVEASARRYLWSVGGVTSGLCRVKVVTHVDEFDSAGGGWLPGYTCECISGVFSIIPGGHSYPDPCPHLYVLRAGEFDLVNSVLRRDRGLRRPGNDYVIVRDTGPDDAGLMRFRIDELDPDTAYIYGVGLAALPGGGNLVVSPDGDLLHMGERLMPVEATTGGKDVLAEVGRADTACFIGVEGTAMTVTFPGPSATEATLVISMAKKDLPELPFGEGAGTASGVELHLAGPGGFVSGGDTTASVVVHPRQFLSETAYALAGLDPASSSLVLEAVWRGEHHLDALFISPKVEPYTGEVAGLEPVRVEYVPNGEPAGIEGDWMVRLLPGERLFLDFKPDRVDSGDDTAYLLSLRGYYVGPGALSGIADARRTSIQLAGGNPCAGPNLSGQLVMASPARMDLAIYDVRGRLVRRIKQGHLEAGTHPFQWDLTSESHQPVAAGLYFLRLDTPQITITRKLVIKR
jgi:hypothetical protein